MPSVPLPGECPTFPSISRRPPGRQCLLRSLESFARAGPWCGGGGAAGRAGLLPCTPLPSSVDTCPESPPLCQALIWAHCAQGSRSPRPHGSQPYGELEAGSRQGVTAAGGGQCRGSGNGRISSREIHRSSPWGEKAFWLLGRAHPPCSPHPRQPSPWAASHFSPASRGRPACLQEAPARHPC